MNLIRIDEELNWKYDYLDSIEIPTKTSVSELKKKHNEENEKHDK